MKNDDPYKYFFFSGYFIAFDARDFFSASDGCEIGKNLIIFRADKSSSVHVDNKKKNLYSSQKSNETVR